MEDEREIDKFSWSGLFIVTSCCCFLFSFALKLLDGQFSIKLILLGVATAMAAVVSVFAGALARHNARRKKNKRFAS